LVRTAPGGSIGRRPSTPGRGALHPSQLFGVSERFRLAHRKQDLGVELAVGSAWIVVDRDGEAFAQSRVGGEDALKMRGREAKRQLGLGIVLDVDPDAGFRHVGLLRRRRSFGRAGFPSPQW
jgi:hypothetical protein